MADAALSWFDYGGDIVLAAGDLVPDEGLASAVLISLFTDARAPQLSELPQGETSLRGWWGDLGQRITGSLLWLIQREKTLPEVALRAQEYAETALAWMIADGVAESVTVVATLVRPFGLQLRITIARGAAKQYSHLWDAVAEYTETKVQNTSIKLQFIQ